MSGKGGGGGYVLSISEAATRKPKKMKTEMEVAGMVSQCKLDQICRGWGEFDGKVLF